MSYLDHLEDVGAEDARCLKKAQESYGDSWKKRGGVGAFMMLARKWDRLEQRCASIPAARGVPDFLRRTGGYGDRWDIFRHIEVDERPEGIIDDVRDLRRYLMLIEAEMIARGHNPDQAGSAAE